MTNFLEKKLVYERVEDYKEIVSSDPYRLQYHIMPHVGLLNDPNGFVFYKGKYHIFYQWNPMKPEHGAKLWGHYISDDMVHWKEAPIALAPDKWYDKNGCYSGSAVVYQDKLYVFYTGNVKDVEGNRESYQCLAVSEDGINFEKKGPIIQLPEGYTAHFRDPKVFFKDDCWYMIIGAQTKELKGEAVIFISQDLINWHFHGPLAGSGHNGLGEFGYMWECPDLFELDGKDILVVCPQGLEAKGYEFNNVYQSGYFTGQVDYDALTYKHGPFVELDRGFDFYAPQTTKDAKGRRLLFGWMGNSEEETIQPTVKHEWLHALTIPRELELKNGKVLQHPIEELRLLRTEEVQHNDVKVVDRLTELPGVEGNVFELEVLVNEREADEFILEVGSSKIIYNQHQQTFTFQRRNFADKQWIESRHCVVKELKKIHLFKDTSSIEIFVNDGEEVFTSRVFDEPDAKRVIFCSDGSVMVDVKKWNLERVFPY